MRLGCIWLQYPIPTDLCYNTIYHSMPMKQLNVTFEDAEFEQLHKVKGDRNWRQAIKEEFDL